MKVKKSVPIPVYVTVKQEFDTMELIPGWTYRRLVFRTDGKHMVASAGDIDWFRHWPLWQRVKFAFGIILGRKEFPQ